MEQQKDSESADHSKEEPSLLRRAMPSLFPVDAPKGLWKVDNFDLNFFKIQIIMTSIAWVLSMASGSIVAFLCYWDGPNYVYAARSLYDVPEDYPWARDFQYPPYYMACHLPGFPLVIRLLSMLCFNQYWLGDILAILVTSLTVTFVFRRLLIVYNVVVDPVWTTTLSLVIPIRFVLYKCVGASEPLYMTYCFLAFIFFKTDQLLFLLVSMWGACITRVEGLALVGTIGLCYLLRLDILRASFTALGFGGTAAVLAMHKYRFGDAKAYFKFNQGAQGLLKYPFYNFIESARFYQTIIMFNDGMALALPFLAGICVLFTNAIPLAIFGVVYFIYTSCLFHPDVFRYALPAYMPALLIGFDSIFSSSLFKKNVQFLIPIYAVVAGLYAAGQIGTNRCDDAFFFEICDPVRWPFPGYEEENAYNPE